MRRKLLSCVALLAAAIATNSPYAAADILKDIGKAVEKGAENTGRVIKEGAQTLEEGAEEAGKAIKQGAQDAGKAIERGSKNAGQVVKEEVQDAGRDLDQFGTDLGRGICVFFDTDKPAQDEFRCKGGVGHDADRGTYTYDAAQPDQRFYGDEDSTDSTLQAKQLRDAAAYLKDSKIQEWEYKDNNVYGIERFLPAGTELGEAWPAAEKEVIPPATSGGILACCRNGGGRFLTARADKGAMRFHAGTDYITEVGETVLSPVSGWVERIKTPGRPGITGLLIVNEQRYSASVYYIEPTPEISAALLNKQRYRVEAGKTEIGVAQDIHPAYPAEVPQHIHVNLSDPNGNAVAPNGKFVSQKTPQLVQK